MKIANCKIENYCCYAFILGREQKIALFELESVLRRFDVCFDILSLQDNIAIIKTNAGFSDQISVVSLMQLLGGTVKIFEIMQNAKFKMQNYGMESLLLDKLSENQTGGTLNFAISDYSGFYKEKELKQIGIEIKKEARKKRPVRFVEGKGTELSSATSYHKIFKTEGEEFGLFKIAKLLNCQIAGEVENGGRTKSDNLTIKQFNNELLIGRLIATTNPDEWSDRDYGKPAGDKFSGMMPPKLARMMVNMVLGENQNLKVKNQNCISKLKIGHSGIEYSLKIENCPEGPELAEGQIDNSNDLVVFDPFCGSGNILMEALLLGCEVIGSDISEKAVEDTRANLAWLCQNSKFKIQNLNSKLKIENFVFKADATKEELIEKLNMFLPKKLKPNAYKLFIVTEPYLGKPKKVKVDRSQVIEEKNELKNIYLNFFKNIASLKPDTYNLITICFVFPIIETLDAGEVSLYNECVDELRQMGYNTTRTLRYGRDYQVVKREIALLQLGNQRTEEQKNQFGNVL
ncbi:MAG: DNA methylase [bacterium ADurb.Bin212]|nr:MAG: DNA methylase [bacterium ADurb.Bin212]